MKRKQKTGESLRNSGPRLLRHVKHSPVSKTRTANILKLVTVLALLAAVVSGAFFFVFDQKAGSPSGTTAEANKEAAELILPAENQSRPVRLNSSFGFGVVYDASSLEASAQTTDASSTDDFVSGTTYTDKELEETRPYSLMKFRLKTDGQNNQRGYTHPELTILTNIRKSYWQNRVNLPENRGKSKLDIFIDQTVSQRTSSQDGMTASKPEKVTVNGTEFRKVTFTQVNDSFKLRTETRDYYYFTVQNDRPYYAAIYNVKDETLDLLTQFEAVIGTLTFTQPDTSQLSKTQPDSDFDKAADDVELPENTANVPTPLSAETILRVAARNQPAVVRVGTVYCADVQLSGAVPTTLEDACNAMIGSGSFVSEDGYIATNGHVVRISPATAIAGYINLAPTLDKYITRVQTVLDYLVGEGRLTRSDAQDFTDALRRGDQAAIEKAASLGSFINPGSISLKDEAYSYAIQTSKDPMRIDLNDARVRFSYSTTILSADYVDSNFDVRFLNLDEATINSLPPGLSDVAILKAKGSFPITKLGAIDGLKSGDRLTAIGFPAFVDGGLSTSRSITVPSITQGFIQDISTLSPTATRKLILTSVPIAQGNSGGPAFNDNGEQIGLNTYSRIPCADLKCFGDGIARDVADYKELLQKNGINLDASSGITDTWDKALNAFADGNYAEAAKLFEKTSRDYPANYLASGLQQLATSKIGSQGDTSAVHQKAGLARTLGIISVVVGILALGSLVAYLVHGSRKHHQAMALQPQQSLNPSQFSAPQVSLPSQPEQPNDQNSSQLPPSPPTA